MLLNPKTESQNGFDVRLSEIFSYNFNKDNFPIVQIYQGHSLNIEAKRVWQIKSKDFLFIPYLINKRIVVLKAKGTLKPRYASLMGERLWSILDLEGVEKLIAVTDLSLIDNLKIGTPSELYSLVNSKLSKTREHEYILPSDKISGVLRMHRMLVRDFRMSTTIISSFESGLRQALNSMLNINPELTLIKEIDDVPSSDLHTKRINQLVKAINSISFDQNFQPVKCDIPVGDPFEKLFKAFHGLQHEIELVLEHVGEVNQQLEKKVNERTKKLLKQTRKLQSLNVQLDRFIYSASHELKEPSASMLGLLNLMEVEENPDKSKMYIDRIKETILKQNLFLKQVIKFRESKGSLLHKDTIMFDTLFEDIIRNLNLENEERTIDIDIKVDQSGPFFTDKIRIEIIVANLLKNAFQYSFDKKVLLQAQVVGTTATLKIQDWGEGIPREALPHVFDVFYRASENRSGMGFGLFMVKEMVDALHGKIQVESERDKGTIFIITLPCLMAHTFPNVAREDNWCQT